MNHVSLIGRVGRDPESKKGGVVKLTLATDDVDKEGNKRAEWHKLTAFGKTAEIIEKYVSKGRQIGVEGRLHTSSWEDKDGQKRYSTEVIVNRMYLLGDRPKAKAREDDAAEDRSEAPRQDIDDDEDVPF